MTPRTNEGEARWQRLPPTLRLRHLVAFALAFMVPIAPFGVFGSIYTVARGQIAAVYLIAAAVMALTAVSFVVLSKEFAGVGSVHAYVGQAMGPVWGFLAGWMLLLDYLLVPGLICVLTANGLHGVVPAVPTRVWVVVVALVATALNRIGLRQTVRASAVLLGLQFVVLAAVVTVTAGFLVRHPPVAALAPLTGTVSSSWQSLFAGVSVAVLSFLGFESVATLGEETSDRRPLVGRAIVLALAVCTVLFVLQSWLAALLVADPALLLAEGDPPGQAFYDAVAVAGGTWAASVAALCVAVSGLANSLVAQATTARLLLSFARAGQAPAALARVDKAPVAAGVVVAVLTLVVALAAAGDGGLALLVTLVNVGALTAFAALHVAVVVHFVIRGGSRRWTHLLVPPAGLLALVVVLVSSADVARGLGATWLVVGVVTVTAWVRRPPARGMPATLPRADR